MGLISRKTVAQVGVILYTISTISSIVVPYFTFISSEYFGLVLVFESVWPILFLVAAIMPTNKDEMWGSMWPLVGYDNVIDGIYTRGPWRIRFAEMDELDREKNVTVGMTSMFDVDGQ